VKRIPAIIAVIAIQIAALLLLARVVRFSGGYFPDVGVTTDAGVTAFAVFAYGVPAAMAFAGHLRFSFRPSRRVQGWIACGMVAAILACLGDVAGIVTLQRTDIWLTHRYMARMQARLLADPRFKDVRLICYSDDYVLFPYIPVSGTVATGEDRFELARILRESHPPAAPSVLVFYGGSPVTGGEIPRPDHDE